MCEIPNLNIIGQFAGASACPSLPAKAMHFALRAGNCEAFGGDRRY